MLTAAVIIIGNEILSGKYADENGPFFIRRFRELCVSLKRMVVISDEPSAIADEVLRCSEACDLVFTTGGVGPTHDDITMESIALGFGVKAVLHPELEAVIRDKVRGQVSKAMLRMALAPEGSELIWDGEVSFPLVKVRNVFILPGVPHIMRLKFEAVAHRFQGTPLSTASVQTSERESSIADRLVEALERFPGVEIGSYPRLEAQPRHVVVTIEGCDAEAVSACRIWLRETLAP